MINKTRNPLYNSILSISPRGSGNNFIGSLLIDEYNINQGYWHDDIANEYALSKRINKHHSGLMYNGKMWTSSYNIDYHNSRTPSIQVFRDHDGYNDIISKHYSHIYYMDVPPTEIELIEYLTSLHWIKSITRSAFWLRWYDDIGLDKKMSNLDKFKQYGKILHKNGATWFPPTSRILITYFLNHNSYNWNDICDYVERERVIFFNNRINTLNEVWDKHQSAEFKSVPKIVYTYDQFLSGNTNTVLDNRLTDIQDYHHRNINLIHRYNSTFKASIKHYGSC